ncbi:MAG: sulfotransferase [Rhodobacter sp.]|nr:sulfotransferase [Rhodobacter sp.]
MFSTIPALRKYSELDGKTFLLCVGAMKCATSWLHDYLDSLSGVAVSPLKELHFFSTKFPAHALGDMDALALKRLGFHVAQSGDGVANLRRRPTFQASVDRVQMIYDDDAYFGHFARLVAPETATFCDVTPAYSVLGPTGFEYLRAFCGSQDIAVKILFVMRDPVDRLWSQLRHMTQTNPENDIVANWSRALESPSICARADYRGTVTDLDQTFPAEDILYLFYEDLFTKPSLTRLCDHVNAGYIAGDAGQVKNETSVKADMPDDARAAAHRLLAPQYDFCRDRFGDAIPASWQG